LYTTIRPKVFDHPKSDEWRVNVAPMPIPQQLDPWHV
jgi:hypothetical protein